jgi:hypothetical protein
MLFPRFRFDESFDDKTSSSNGGLMNGQVRDVDAYPPPLSTVRAYILDCTLP